MSIIGITMGCPAGIGPEIILKYFHDRSEESPVTPVVVGDKGVLEHCARELNIPIDITTWSPGENVLPATLPVLERSRIHTHQWGKPTKESAVAMVDYIHTAVRLAQEGTFGGIATCPIAKDALQQAGFNYPGHTEMLAELTGCRKFTMMMAGSRLRVTLATIHCPYSDVPSRLNVHTITELIDITHHALQVDFGIMEPRIAVAGLNPHAGESGIFGSEEERIIQPAVEDAARRGIQVSGPYPPDTVFYKAAGGEADCVICMYHDQGLIPFKLLHFEDGVNVTLGLPIVRTSVDHGTAYDIAGKGLAKPDSLVSAVSLAGAIGRNRTKFSKSIG